MPQRLIPTGEQSGLFDAHRDDGKRFVVHADEKLTAFLELESAIRPFGENCSEISHRQAKDFLICPIHSSIVFSPLFIRIKAFRSSILVRKGHGSWSCRPPDGLSRPGVRRPRPRACFPHRGERLLVDDEPALVHVVVTSDLELTACTRAPKTKCAKMHNKRKVKL